MKQKTKGTISIYLILTMISCMLSIMNINASANNAPPPPYIVNTTFNMQTLIPGAVLNANVSVTNNSESMMPTIAIVALYDSSNKMINISYNSKSIDMGKSETLTAGFKLPDDITGYVAKVFVWDGTSLTDTNMMPLSNAVSLDETGIQDNLLKKASLSGAYFLNTSTIQLLDCNPSLDGKLPKNFLIKCNDAILTPNTDYTLDTYTSQIILMGKGIPDDYKAAQNYTVAYVDVEGYLDSTDVSVDYSRIVFTPNLISAQFNGLTIIQAQSDVDLTGIGTDDVQITLPDQSILPQDKILSVDFNNDTKTLRIKIDSSAFARITSEGTSISTKAFGLYTASSAVVVQKTGEPAENGKIRSLTNWTDMGHFTNYNTFTSPQPNMDIHGNPISTPNGTKVPVKRTINMLVLFVEFPDAKNSASTGSFNGINFNSGMQAYMDFLSGAKQWYANSSYGQLELNLISPQNENNLGWIQMSKNSSDYTDSGYFSTAALHIAYIREACQYAFDHWGIRADEYDALTIIPAKSQRGILNGPAYIRSGTYNAHAYMDNGTPRYIKTASTAGADLYSWGYKWLVHETGHNLGLPDTYGWELPNSMFWIGGWGMMGNIGGQSTDHFAWEKWKFGWIRDDQVDVTSKSGKTTHYLSPVEAPGGTKMVVIPVSSSLVYVAEFRTKQGNNAEIATDWGVLIYRMDSSATHSYGPVTADKVPKACAQVISNYWFKQGYTSLPFRPINSSLSGYDSGCCFQPGDSFTDMDYGITIHVEDISNYSTYRTNGLYTANDVATVTVTRN